MTTQPVPHASISRKVCDVCGSARAIARRRVGLAAVLAVVAACAVCDAGIEAEDRRTTSAFRRVARVMLTRDQVAA